MHIAVDALGNPVRLRLTPGQSREASQAEVLIAGLPAAFVIGDTALDSDRFRACVAAQGAEAVIPSNPSRARVIGHDKQLYKERHVERPFSRLRHDPDVRAEPHSCLLPVILNRVCRSPEEVFRLLRRLDTRMTGGRRRRSL